LAADALADAAALQAEADAVNIERTSDSDNSDSSPESSSDSSSGSSEGEPLVERKARRNFQLTQRTIGFIQTKLDHCRNERHLMIGFLLNKRIFSAYMYDPAVLQYCV